MTRRPAGHSPSRADRVGERRRRAGGMEGPGEALLQAPHQPGEVCDPDMMPTIEGRGSRWWGVNGREIVLQGPPGGPEVTTQERDRTHGRLGVQHAAGIALAARQVGELLGQRASDV